MMSYFFMSGQMHQAARETYQRLVDNLQDEFIRVVNSPDTPADNLVASLVMLTEGPCANSFRVRASDDNEEMLLTAAAATLAIESLRKIRDEDIGVRQWAWCETWQLLRGLCSKESAWKEVA